jgi:hypothetical protein
MSSRESFFPRMIRPWVLNGLKKSHKILCSHIFIIHNDHTYITEDYTKSAVVYRNESVLKNIFKKGYEEIRDRKLLEILKKDRTWLKYELHWHKILCSHIFIIHNDHTYITEDYTKLCLNIICNRSCFILKLFQLKF